MRCRFEIAGSMTRAVGGDLSWIVLALASSLVAAPAAAAADGGATQATEEVTQSLEAMGSLPWYDPADGGVEPVDVRPRIDDSVNRDSRWLAKPKAPGATPANPNVASGNRASANRSAERIGWVVLGVIMALLVALLVYTFMRIDDAPAAGEPSERDDERPKDLQARMENLPMDLRKPVGDLLQEADRLYAAGQMDEAIIYLFGHRLLQLDRHQAIRLARGKTNRQYLSELYSRPELQPIVRETVNLFEESYFGRYAVAPGRFDDVRGRQAEFESLLARVREAA